MSPESLASQIKSLETQLAVLKAQVRRASAARPTKTFADLYGIAAGGPSPSDADFEEARYHFDSSPWCGDA